MMSTQRHRVIAASVGETLCRQAVHLLWPNSSVGAGHAYITHCTFVVGSIIQSWHIDHMHTSLHLWVTNPNINNLKYPHGLVYPVCSPFSKESLISRLIRSQMLVSLPDVCTSIPEGVPFVTWLADTVGSKYHSSLMPLWTKHAC